MATYKQIEQARETRLWIGQIIVPAVTTLVAAGVVLVTNPDVRRWVGDKVSRLKNKFGKSEKIEIEP
jgi:hypothetical protein